MRNSHEGNNKFSPISFPLSIGAFTAALLMYNNNAYWDPPQRPYTATHTSQYTASTYGQPEYQPSCWDRPGQGYPAYGYRVQQGYQAYATHDQRCYGDDFFTRSSTLVAHTTIHIHIHIHSNLLIFQSFSYIIRYDLIYFPRVTLYSHILSLSMNDFLSFIFPFANPVDPEDFIPATSFRILIRGLPVYMICFTDDVIMKILFCRTIFVFWGKLIDILLGTPIFFMVLFSFLLLEIV